MDIKDITACLIALALATGGATAQGTLEDYRRAYSLHDKFNAPRVYDDPAEIRWDNDSVFHYFTYTADGRA